MLLMCFCLWSTENDVCTDLCWHVHANAWPFVLIFHRRPLTPYHVGGVTMEYLLTPSDSLIHGLL